jgi:tetratricopeptide (TPR) repeat protein
MNRALSCFCLSFHFCTVAIVLVSLQLLAAAQSAIPSPWDAPAFTAPASEIVAASAVVKAKQYAKVTILLEERHVTIDDAQCATQSSHMIYRVEDKSALPGWATIKSNWLPWRQKVPRIRARVIAPDGSVSELDTKVLSDTPAHDQRPEIYEDQRSLSGPLPNVQPGSIVEQEIVWEDTAPATTFGSVRRYYIGNSSPTEHSRFAVTVPEKSAFQYRLRGGANVQLEREKKDGRLTLSFEQGAMDAWETAENDFAAEAEPWPSIDYSTAASWNAVAAGYYAEIEPAIQPNETSALLQGTKGLARPELLRKIVSNLHHQVRYTGLEFGAAALIPHKTAETLKTGYGDCKDKAIVLVSALKSAGIDAKLALLMTRGSADVSPDLPGINIFDHAIVYVPGTPALWIDATAEFFPPGALPWADQGRLALVIDSNTKGLLRIPISQPEENVQRSRREVFLSEYGPARIVETFEGIGPEDAALRSYYGQAESKEAQEGLERHGKNTFLAEKMDEVTHGSGSEMSQPFQIKLVFNKGRRGSTDMKTAVFVLPNTGLMWQYPSYITDDDGVDKPETPGWKPRKTDVELEPFTTDWQYHVTPPPGFESPTLPKDDEVKFGPARLTRHYHLEKDGSVTGRWLFSSVKARMSPAELKEFRQSLYTFERRDMTSISFKQKGAALLAEGRNKEALAAYRELINLHPSEALHHLQMANALLEAGFGEAAREEARRGTDLDPKSAEAWSTLAWILEHDAIGRRFGAGFDREGSVAAYRKAIELDPKEWTSVVDFAILLEHNSYGERYETGADLDGAAANYRLLRTVNKEQAPRYDSNLAFVLLYGGKWSEAIEFCASTPSDATRTAISLAALAERDGAPAAIAEVQHSESTESARSTMLTNAATMLLRMRAYPQAIQFLHAAEAGAEDRSQLRSRIQMLEAVHKYEEVFSPASDPRTVVRGFYSFLLDSHAEPEEMYRYTEGDPDNQKSELESAARGGYLIRSAIARSADLTATEVRDLTLSNLQTSMEGDDAGGYRMRVRAIGDMVQTFFVVKRDEGYRIIAEDQDLGLIGREVLSALQRKDLKHAKQWLDWAREERSLSSGDDPLAGYVFSRFWTRGDDTEPRRMRLAAIALISQMKGVREFIPELKALREQAKGEDAERLDLLLAWCGSSAKDWKLVRETGSRLFAAHPLSDTALRFMQSASIFGHEPELGRAAVAQRLAKLPDDLPGLRASAAIAESISEFTQARSILRGIIDKNRATMNDFNQYTWLALFGGGKVSDEDVAILQRAITADRNSSFAEIHTLACLYADQGKTKDARELLLRAMSSGGLDKPDSNIWYGFGRIAEQYGLTDVANLFYTRVEKGEDDDMPTSTFSLAQQRRKLLAATADPKLQAETR